VAVRDAGGRPAAQTVGTHLDFYGLSLADLAMARALFHVQLLDHENVVGTAVGRYLIRKSDPWPTNQAEEQRAISTKRTNKPPRTLGNSEVRVYSWPCVLVFVREWVDYGDVEKGKVAGDVLLPKQLWLPDGRVVPVCVVEAKPVELGHDPVETMLFPGAFLGPGYPITREVQGLFRVGTAGPLVTDGQRTYALTSRHVLGAPGSEVHTFVHGTEVAIGVAADAALSRVPMDDAYPELESAEAYLNVDVGLIDVDEADRWTSVAYGIGPLAPIADARSASLSLALIGRGVVAHGAVGGAQRGEVKGLLFRYKSIGGAEYYTDFLIGSSRKGHPLTTRPGDSGAVWCLEPDDDANAGLFDAVAARTRRVQPLALQWGGEVLHTTADATAPYVLATSLATVCRLLDLDLVWDWQANLFRYWGAVGHYSIALRAIEALPHAELKTLLTANRDNITFPQDHISDTDLKGLSKKFVPLADVPDLAWKLGAYQRGPRNTNPERPNHHADMDKPRPDGKTLLDLSAMRADAIDPEVWRKYYDDVGMHDDMNRGLLPFRVWQIYDGMVDALSARSVTRFVCAAGVLAHYVGDACQPLHISMYADGDPAKHETRTVHHRDGTVEQQNVKLGAGVHAAYEDAMVNLHVPEIFAGLQSLPAAKPKKVGSGADAAWATIQLMRATYDAIPPKQLVDTYVGVEHDGPKAAAKKLWDVYGPQTITVIGDGVETLAGLWLSAWKQAHAEGKGLKLDKIPQEAITKTIARPSFLRSYTLDQIGAHL
jgi:hypothetical protein